MQEEKIRGSFGLVKKHIDADIILTAFGFSVLWMNGKFNDIEKQFAEIYQELDVVKAILIIKSVKPKESAQANK